MADIPINAVHRRIQYTSSGSAGPYNFAFAILDEGDLAVYDSTTLKILTTHYTVSLSSDGTGSITFTSGNEPASSNIVTITSDQAVARTSDFTTGGDFKAATINDELDRITIIQQQLESLVRRCIQIDAFANRDISDSGAGPLAFPYDDTVADQADKAVVFGAAGTTLVAGPSTTDISSAATNATAAATSATASATSATAASTPATAASTSATAAATSATNASSSADAAAATAAGIRWKDRTKAATTANITLSGAQTIDGISIVASDRVLVKNQSSSEDNGIYIAAAGAWARATDMDAWLEVPSAACAVEQGTVNADRTYICTADTGGTLETTAITWAQFGGGDVVAANNGTEFTESTFKTNLNMEAGVDFQAYDADTLKADTADVLTAGFANTIHDLGTITSGTVTPNEANGNMQKMVNNGAHTLAVPANDCTMIIQVTNDSSAGTVTTSAYDIVDGDSLTTTNGDDFFYYITNMGTFTLLTVKALQ